MHSQEAGRSRALDKVVWCIVAAVAAVVLASTLAAGFRIVWLSFAAPALTVAALVGLLWFYTARRPDPRIAAGLEGTAQLIAFAAIAAPLSYVGASLNFPLRDRLFDAADRAMGFDWLGLLAWMDAHAAFHPLFREIYLSLMPQTVVVVLALSFARKYACLQVFMLAFVIGTLITIAIAALLPAEGVWGYYKLQAAAYPEIAPATQRTHLPIFHGLRDGSFRVLMASGAEGIITFPSLHTTLALLLTMALWPLAWLRWPVLAVNVIMLVSIPVDGGHYFIDMLTGLAIAIVSYAAARAIFRRTQRPSAAAPALAAAKLKSI